jgi:hypothetical protein
MQDKLVINQALGGGAVVRGRGEKRWKLRQRYHSALYCFNDNVMPRYNVIVLYKASSFLRGSYRFKNFTCYCFEKL